MQQAPSAGKRVRATAVKSTINQSEFEANLCNRRQARENASEQAMIGFGLAPHWLKK